MKYKLYDNIEVRYNNAFPSHPSRLIGAVGDMVIIYGLFLITMIT